MVFLSGRQYYEGAKGKIQRPKPDEARLTLQLRHEDPLLLHQSQGHGGYGLA